MRNMLTQRAAQRRGRRASHSAALSSSSLYSMISAIF
jgi:hypothetical protein